jgi:hypothetical protein
VSETKVTEPTILVLKMVDWLHGANYRAAPTEDGRGVVSGTSGFQFLIQAFESSIQFHMGLRLSKDQLTYEDCNRQNRTGDLPKFTWITTVILLRKWISSSILIVPTPRQFFWNR